MIAARIFVAVAFTVLGASFLLSTGLLISDFRGGDWLSMVMAHSHLFFFFPVFGLLALAAFYLPSVVFTDLYWSHLPWGKARFAVGFAVLVAAAIYFAGTLDKEPRAIWEVSRAALEADKGDPAGCGTGNRSCIRMPILTAFTDMRREAQARTGLSRFSRNCAADDMLEPDPNLAAERQCFAAGVRLDAKTCCEAQGRYAAAVNRLHADPAQRSLAGAWDRVLLPFKVFFILVVAVIGLFLAVWRRRLDEHYPDQIGGVERGVVIGATAMLFWPAMDYAYQQTANVLFGRWSLAPQLRLSLVIAPWALLLLFYFLRRLGQKGQSIGQTAGVITAAAAVLRYEDLNDWGVRLLGIGAQPWIAYALVIVAVAGFALLLWGSRIDYTIPARTVRRNT